MFRGKKIADGRKEVRFGSTSSSFASLVPF